MKHIKLADVQVTEEWIQKATDALDVVRLKDGKDRKVAINAHSDVWADVKPTLAKLSDEKCWYCEARQHRSDNNIDHFRPKNAVAEAKGHGGYWWLAFNVSNFRYSCTFCNARRTDVEQSFTGGKSSHFPLLNPEARITDPSQNVAQEHPMLLDPTVDSDPLLLYFEDDGRVVPTYDENKQPIANRRALTSIDLYHLNHTVLKKARKRLYNKIRDLVTMGDEHFIDPLDARYEQSRAILLSQLLELQEEDIEYWAATRRYLSSFVNSSKRPWLEAVVTGG